jgi:hypothetical protein
MNTELTKSTTLLIAEQPAGRRVTAGVSSFSPSPWKRNPPTLQADGHSSRAKVGFISVSANDAILTSVTRNDAPFRSFGLDS